MLKYFILALSLFNLNVLAASVKFPDVFNVLKVNGGNFASSFSGSESTISLSAGQQVIVVEYKELFDDYNRTDHTRVKSDPFVIIFTAKDIDYYVKAPSFAGDSIARDFASSPKISMFTNKNEPVAVEVLFLNDYEKMSHKKVSLPSSHSAKMQTTEDDVIPTYRNHPTQTPPDARETSESENIYENSDSGSKNVNMLTYWWQKASAEERQQFLTTIGK